MKIPPTIIVLIGITGDLAQRKLLPAIENLRKDGLLPEKFRVIGITRREHPEFFIMDLGDVVEYQRLKSHLEDAEREWDEPVVQRLYYLSVAPAIALPIIEHLGRAELATSQIKLLLEKPFGVDLKSAYVFLDVIGKYFNESQLYRIDHYLGKDTVRALEAAIIDKKDLVKIEVTASEALGIEGRGNFYEQTGALRDFVQSHLLEVAAVLLSPDCRHCMLEQLYIPKDIGASVKRAQYKGYRQEVGNTDSVVETKVSVLLHSNDSALNDVQIVLQTGKAMSHKETSIKLHYANGRTAIITLDDKKNAYENILLDAMRGEKKYFISKEEVLAAWKIVDPIWETWKKSSQDLQMYSKGSVL